MKKSIYFIIGGSCFLILLVLLILTLILKFSWWWFISLLILFFILFAVLITIKILSKKIERGMIVEPADKVEKVNYIEIAKSIILNDMDDFLINPQEISAEVVGAEGETKTPIFVIKGDGYWYDNGYYFITINKDDVNDYIIRKMERKEEEKEKEEEEKQKQKMAKHPKILKTTRREKYIPETGASEKIEIIEETPREMKEREEKERKEEEEVI